MKKIAVMLPAPYRGGSLRAAKNIARALSYQAHERGMDLQVVFSYVRSGKYNLHTDFKDLLQAGCVLRETEWKVTPRRELLSAAGLAGIDPESLESAEYCLPVDGANDFFDCDLWLIISDRLPAPLFPLRKYACIIYDYIQRYVPAILPEDEKIWQELMPAMISFVRGAARVFVTTPSTLEDLVSYAGVPRSNISRLDMEFAPLEAPSIDKPEPSLAGPYVIWPSNSTLHKNHLTTFDAIDLYLNELGGGLHFVLTGFGMEYFDPSRAFAAGDAVMQAGHVRQARARIARDPLMMQRLHFAGSVPDRRYAGLLKNARFLLHPTLYDNGTFSVLEAAYLGVPSLSARYPAMEYMDQHFGLNLQFFDPRDPQDLAEALLSMERLAGSIPLPDRDSLSRHDWRSLSPRLFEAILGIL